MRAATPATAVSNDMYPYAHTVQELWRFTVTDGRKRKRVQNFLKALQQ